MLGTAENVRDLAKILRAVSTIPREKNLRGLPKNPLIATGVKRTLSGDAARRRARNERNGRAGVGGQHLQCITLCEPEPDRALTSAWICVGLTPPWWRWLVGSPMLYAVFFAATGLVLAPLEH